MFTGLGCVFASADRCFACQKTTGERHTDALAPKSANETQGCQVLASQETRPHPRRVSTHPNGTVPRRHHGLSGGLPVQRMGGAGDPRVYTCKEALDKARAIPEAVESRSVDPGGARIDNNEEVEVAVFARSCFRKDFAKCPYQRYGIAPNPPNHE